MKKNIVLTALMALITTGACFAQHTAATKAHIGINQQYHKTDTTCTFSIFGPDQEVLLQRIKKAFGKPVTDNTGNIQWEGIAVKDIAQKFNIRLNDGIYYIKGDAYLEFFKNAEDKRAKLAGLKKGEKRIIEIEFTDASGINIINNKTEETAIEAFLLNIIRKS